ncbi:MAG TPA: hypothetical protein VE777_17905 [Gaiellales bacterium]|jgi:hypothetical protein|nr:hypothetical protein [Gaiellales bacterium]
MPVVHAVVGALVILTNAAAGVWGYAAYRRDRPPRPAYQQLLAAAQTLVIGQATLGLILLSQGNEPGDRLHFVYGLLPLLAVAYPYALRGDDGRRNLLLFSVSSALIAALGIRAFMTGPH